MTLLAGDGTTGVSLASRPQTMGTCGAPMCPLLSPVPMDAFFPQLGLSTPTCALHHAAVTPHRLLITHPASCSGLSLRACRGRSSAPESPLYRRSGAVLRLAHLHLPGSAAPHSREVSDAVILIPYPHSPTS